MKRLMQERTTIWELMCQYKIECALIAVGMTMGLIFFDYVDGISLTTYSIEFWDAIFSERILEIPQVMVENGRGSPHAGIGFGGAGILAIIPWAIWNFPLWLTHMDPVSMVNSPLSMAWSKLFLILCALVAGMVCYHLVLYITGNKARAQLAALFFWGSGTLFISIGYSGQDEIIYLLVFLLGVYSFVREKIYSGLAWFVVAVTLAPFMILPVFLVLAVYEKNLIKIIGYSILMLTPFFVIGKLFPAIIPVNDNYLDWFFGRSSIPTGFGSASIFAILLIILYGLAYCKERRSNEQRARDLTFLLAALLSGMTLISWVHFYRYILYFPFLLICVLTSRGEHSDKTQMGLVILIVLEMIRTVTSFFTDANSMLPAAVQTWCKEKIPSAIERYSFSELLHMRFSLPSESSVFLVSASLGLLIFIFYLLWRQDFVAQPLKFPMKWLIRIYVAFVPLLVLSLFLIIFQFQSIGSQIEGNDQLAPAISDHCSIEQHFFSGNIGQIDFVRVRPVTWGRNYPDDVNLNLTLIDAETQETQARASVRADELPNNDFYTFSLSKTDVERNKWYTLRLYASGTIENKDDYINLLRTPDGTANNEVFYTTVTNCSTGETIEATWNVVDSIVGWK